MFSESSGGGPAGANRLSAVGERAPRRGRRPATAAERAEARERLLDATEAVFARRGFHGVTMVAVADESGSARPTFYRYFESVEQATDQMITRLADDLVATLGAVGGADHPGPRAPAVARAYRAWTARHGPAAVSFLAALRDPHCWVAEQRAAVHAAAAAALTGRPDRCAEPAALDLLIRVIELGCSDPRAGCEGGAGAPARTDRLLTELARAAGV